ncbi:hypothetical protein ILUMI_03056 [Ignelater luminosus]|uniref:Uncharacterized protein n=1 Tax=Ignelater luminosus TaxID=2038154 RepID=A0A8K0DBN9_IGNLU|nr:hypothetical protein ILUMI_03056 [Ignelater luminosus]
MSEKTSPDTVPGLGFKDKEKALDTLKNLEGRDPDYQKLAIKGLIGRAKRTLTLTKAEDKLQNIKDALEVFEDWLKNFEKLNLGKENRPYLPLPSVQILSTLKEKYGVGDKKTDAFIAAYQSVGGDYKHLRTVSSGEGEPTWDIVRNAALKELMNIIDDESPELWGDDELPTEEHLKIILWAYSPDASKIKKNILKFEEKLGKKEDSKRKHSSDSEQSEEEKGSKRRSSSSSDEESPKKKSKK